MANGEFTENFVRIDTNDSVAGVMIIKNRKEGIIDLEEFQYDVRINSKEEAKELIKLIEDGIEKL